jgi:hypothetical protein
MIQLYFLETAMLLMLSVALAIFCCWFAERKQEPNRDGTTTTSKGDGEVNKEGLNFYLAIMIGGVFVGLFVSTLLETFNALLDKVYVKNFQSGVGTAWAILLVGSSVLLWQLVKWVMGRLYKTPRKVLRLFDVTTIVFCIIGIGAVIYFLF